MGFYDDKIPKREPYETDAAWVTRIRQATGIGMYDAKKIVRKDKLLTEIERAEDLGDIKRILKEMVDPSW